MGPTKPEAGVMVASPAIEPVADDEEDFEEDDLEDYWEEDTGLYHQ